MSDAQTQPQEPARGHKYGGLTPAEREEERRTRLLDAGFDLFAEHGFANTGVRDICRAAKITERAFYDAVGTRENLLRLVYLRAVEEVLAAITASQVAGEDPGAGRIADRLRKGLTAFFSSITEDPRRGRLIYVESLGRGPEIEDVRRQGLQRFVQLAEHELGPYLPDPPPSSASIEAAVSAAMVAIGEIAYRIAIGETKFRPAEAVDRLTVAIVGASIALGLSDAS